MRRLILLFCLLLSVQLIGGCADSNSDAPTAGSVHPASWVDPRLVDTSAFHGSSGGGVDFSECEICHGSDLSGLGDVPGCLECHFDLFGSRVPPDSGWTHGQNLHSDQVAFQNTCNACHEVYRRFGLAPEKCHDCHGTGITHPLGQPWLDAASSQFHGDSDLVCSDCHDLNVKCFECHFGPTGSRSPAGSGWIHAVGDHGDLESQGDVCNICHTLTRSFRGDPGACHDCHGAAHPTGASWLLPSGSTATSHVLVSIADLTGCLSCHSPSGGVSPLCTDCHTASAPNQDASTCDSCHNTPPDAGTFPNRGRGHQAHFLLPSFTGQDDCFACHSGAGSDTLVHWYPMPTSPADMAILGNAGAYQAKTGGAPTYSPSGNFGTGTCSNISCHGGQTTPDWATGTINVNIDTGDNTDGCRRCHQEDVNSDQYNSYSSGRHRLHIINRGILCTVCHDTALLNRITTPNHFSDLDTTTFEWDPAQTLDSRLQYDTAPTPPTCNPSAGGLTGCHGEKDWKP